MDGTQIPEEKTLQQKMDQEEFKKEVEKELEEDESEMDDSSDEEKDSKHDIDKRISQRDRDALLGWKRKHASAKCKHVHTVLKRPNSVHPSTCPCQIALHCDLHAR